MELRNHTLQLYSWLSTRRVTTAEFPYSSVNVAFNPRQDIAFFLIKTFDRLLTKFKTRWRSGKRQFLFQRKLCTTGSGNRPSNIARRRKIQTRLIIERYRER